jgi:hypothetical protein
MQDGEISYSTQQYKRMQHTVLEVSQTNKSTSWREKQLPFAITIPPSETNYY